ncbi:MAG: DUF3137 domain-containing protein [Verrucomicrobiia bacterium]|jgi:hypothetical protein
MSFLKSIFGPSQDEIWSQIAAEIGGDYIDGGFWNKSELRFRHGEWELLLDTYTVSTSNGKTSSSTTYTRLRAPFVNKDDLYFKIYREGFFATVGKFFGMQDINIGDPYFDDSFVIKGNQEVKIRQLLADAELKKLIDRQPQVHLEIRDDEGWFGGDFPEGTDELYFQRVGLMKETQELKDLFQLFCRTLERLVQIDSAYEDDPKVKL